MTLAAALIGAATAAWKASRATTAHQWYAVGMLVLSETLIDAGLSPRRPKEIRHADGRTETVTLGAIAGHPPLLALRERMIDELLNAALIGLGIGVGIAVAVLATLHYASGRLKRGRRLRGGELVSARQFCRRVAPWRLRLRRRFGRPAGWPYRIAGIPLKFPGAWPVARIRLRYVKRPKVAERFVPWVEEKAGTGQVGMPEDDGTARPGEAKDAVEQAPEAEAAVDLWELDPPPPGNGNPASASRSGSAPSAVESGTNEGKAEVVRTDPNAERLEADAEPRNASQPELLFAEDADADGRVVGGAARTDVESGAGPDDGGRPPGATMNREDMRGGKSPDGAKPEGGMIRI